MHERFVVRYMVEWMGTPRERHFPTFAAAVNFANRITTDGTTTYPDVAAITRLTRQHKHCDWEQDQSFGISEVSGGKNLSVLNTGVIQDYAWGHV